MVWNMSWMMGSGGYIDSDWVGCAVERKSTLGCGFGLGSGVISLFNRK
jgi:hypothetical protein